MNAARECCHELVAGRAAQLDARRFPGWSARGKPHHQTLSASQICFMQRLLCPYGETSLVGAAGERTNSSKSDKVIRPRDHATRFAGWASCVTLRQPHRSRADRRWAHQEPRTAGAAALELAYVSRRPCRAVTPATICIAVSLSRQAIAAGASPRRNHTDSPLAGFAW